MPAGVHFWKYFSKFSYFSYYRCYQILLTLGLFASLYSLKPKKLKHVKIAESRSEMYCGLAKHILLLLFTFGIWDLIWTYRTTKHTNIPGEEYRNPTNKLLLCMFVPFYSIFWTYKTAQRIDKLASAAGITSEIATVSLILSIFVPLIPPILMQDKLNAIVSAEANGRRADCAVPE